MLKVENVSVIRYKDGKCNYNLSNLSFNLQSGQFAVVLGDSGSGKTTLIDTIAGFIRPLANSSNIRSRTEFKGKIIIDSTDVTLFEPRDRSVGLVMQRFTLYPHMTVKGNLEFPLKMRKVPKVEWEQKIKEVSEMLNIKSELDKGVEKISGGQAQRVAIGKLILRNPKVALFDEAFSHLDPLLRKKLRDEVIQKIVENKKSIAIFVSHEVKDAKMAHTIIVLNIPQEPEDKILINIFTGNKQGDAWKEMEKTNIVQINQYVNTVKE